MSTAAALTLDREVEKYARIWAECLASLQQVIPEATSDVLSQPPSESIDSEDKDVWISAASQKLGGAVVLRVTSKLARRLLQEPSSDVRGTELGEQERAGLLEFIRKLVNSVDEHSPQQTRGDFSVNFSDGPSTSKALPLWLRLQADAQPIVIEIRFDEGLVKTLQSGVNKDVASEPAFPATADRAQQNLLMGVELAATLRFGGRSMPLKDILDLCAGSVVELDQEIQEPVDLLLDGRLVARGEVVVVDGSYGLRVTEVVTRLTL
jgi:flagellar motor switch protein FliN